MFWKSEGKRQREYKGHIKKKKKIVGLIVPVQIIRPIERLEIASWEWLVQNIVEHWQW